ncbi:hypothetical protein GCM10020256_11230 [Streptomyces thermocoprophilus]
MGGPGVVPGPPGLTGCGGPVRSARGTGGRRLLRGGSGRARLEAVHGLLVEGLVEDFGVAVDRVSGQEQGGDGAVRQVFLLLGTEVVGHGVPDVERLACGVFVAFEAELFQQVVEAGGGAPVGVSAWMVVVRALM